MRGRKRYTHSEKDVWGPWHKAGVAGARGSAGAPGEHNSPWALRGMWDSKGQSLSFTVGCCHPHSNWGFSPLSQHPSFLLYSQGCHLHRRCREPSCQQPVGSAAAGGTFHVQGTFECLSSPKRTIVNFHNGEFTPGNCYKRTERTEGTKGGILRSSRHQ